MPVPADATCALAGEAGCDDVATSFAQQRQGSLDCGQNRGNHFVAILLRPVWLRSHEAYALLGACQHAPAAIQHHGAARMRALVDGEITRILTQSGCEALWLLLLFVAKDIQTRAILGYHTR